MTEVSFKLSTATEAGDEVEVELTSSNDDTCCLKVGSLSVKVDLEKLHHAVHSIYKIRLLNL